MRKIQSIAENFNDVLAELADLDNALSQFQLLLSESDQSFAAQKLAKRWRRIFSCLRFTLIAFQRFTVRLQNLLEESEQVKVSPKYPRIGSYMRR